MKVKNQYEIKVVNGNLEFDKLSTNVSDDYLSITVSISIVSINDNFSPWFKCVKVKNTQEEINQKFWFSVGIVFGRLVERYNYSSLKEINTILTLTVENE